MKADKQKVTIGASVLSAIVASLCCIGPLVAALLGLSGFAASAFFAKWRPLLLGVTFALLGLAWYLTYRRPKEECAEGAACATKPVGKWNKRMLWVATAVVLMTAAFLAVSGLIGRLTQSTSPTVVTSGDSSRLVVKIPSMDCQACAVGIQATIQRQNGVQSARVSFATKEAVVQYDPHKTSKEKLIAAINQTGFKAQL